MAEVTGDLGGQPIQLNNAATETTLRQLLAVMMAQAAKNSKQSLKDEKELRKELQALADAAKKTSAEHKKYRDKLAEEIKDKEGKKSREEQVTQYKKVGKELQNFARGVESTIKSITNFASGLASMGNSVSSATNSLNAIPIVGGMLATTLGAVAKEAERQQKAFQQATAVGATFGGGITEMVNSASKMGLTFDQFSGIINRSGREIALLGEGSADGAKQLVKYSTAMRNSGLQDDLARLGFSAEEITGSLAKYGAQLKTLGYSQAQIDATLVQSTGDYLKNLDAVSKITGLNRQDLEKQRAERLKDSQFRAMMIGKDEGTVKAMNSLLDTMDESQAKAFKELAATGTAASDEAKALFTTAPQLAQAAMGAYNSMQTTGKYTMDQAASAHAAAQQEAKQRVDMLKQLALYGDETQKRMALAAMNMGAQTLTLGESIKKTEDAAKSASANDPAALMRQQQKVAESSNKASLELANAFSRIVPILDKFYEVLHNYVLPTLSWATENIGLAAAAIVGLKVASAVASLGFEKVLGRIAGGKAAGTVSKAGLGSTIKTVLGIITSVASAKLILGGLLAAGIVGSLWTLSKDFREGKSEQDELRDLDKRHAEGKLTPDEKKRRDELRAKGRTASMGEGTRGSQRFAMTLGKAETAMATTHASEDEIKKEYGYSRKVIAEYLKQGGKKDILAVAKELGEGVHGYIEKGSTGYRGPESLPVPEQPSLDDIDTSAADALDEVTTAATSASDAISVTAELAKIQQEMDKAGLGLFEKIALAKRKFELEQLQRTKDQVQVTDKLIDATKEEVALKEKTGACKGYDFSSPEALFKSFREKNMQPGATGTPSAGGTTSTPGAPGTVGSTQGTVGGSSYSEIIGKYEGAGKYDTVFGKAGGAKINDKLITENTIAEVVAWQKANKHTNRHAAGKYGFIDVADVAKEAGIAADAMFNAETQEKMQQAFTARSARVLKGLGIEATNENLALAHSVGPGGAQKLLNAQKSGQGSAVAADVLGLTGAGRTTNPQLLKPVSEVIASHINRFKGQTVPNAVPGGTALQGSTVPNATPSGVAPPRPPVTPTATAVTSTIAPTTPVAVPGRTTPNQPGTGAPGAGGATPANEIAGALERLNSMTAQLVGYNKDVAETSRLQLSAIKSIGKVY